MKLLRRLAFAGLVAVASTSAAVAQDYPTRAVTLVVPYVPGGSTDIVGRMLAAALEAKLGQPVVVENKGGATSAIGSQYVAQSEPDGYTILLAASALLVNEAIRENLQYELTDLAPVSRLVGMPLAIVVAPDDNAATLQEFIAEAKAEPGSVTYGSAGLGSSNHLAPEVLAQKAGLEMVHVPYKGIGPAMTDLMGKRLQMLFGTIPAVKSAIDGKAVRALAVTSAERVGVYPDIPTIAESGVANFELVDWLGIFVPSKTDPAVAARIEAAIRSVYEDETFKKKLSDLGFVPEGTTAAEFRELIAADQWGKTASDLGLKATD